MSMMGACEGKVVWGEEIFASNPAFPWKGAGQAKERGKMREDGTLRNKKETGG